jgi:hypothetical protein
MRAPSKGDVQSDIQNQQRTCASSSDTMCHTGGHYIDFAFADANSLLIELKQHLAIEHENPSA